MRCYQKIVLFCVLLKKNYIVYVFLDNEITPLYVDKLFKIIELQMNLFKIVAIFIRQVVQDWRRAWWRDRKWRLVIPNV